MHDLEKYLPPHLMKDDSFESGSLDFHYRYLSENCIRVANKDGLPTSIQDELEYNKEYYRSIAHE